MSFSCTRHLVSYVSSAVACKTGSPQALLQLCSYPRPGERPFGLQEPPQESTCDRSAAGNPIFTQNADTPRLERGGTLVPSSLAGPRSMGPSSQRTNTEDHTRCAVRALMPMVDVPPLHVCHGQEPGLSPLARTYSRIWAVLGGTSTSARSVSFARDCSLLVSRTKK